MYTVFDWDDANLDHIARHGVEDYEVEEVFDDRRRKTMEAHNAPREKRFALLGATESGRVLVVVYTLRHERVRVVTARDGTEKEKRRY